MAGSIPTRQFGRYDEQVSLLGVGGAHLAGKDRSEQDAIRIVHECIDAGATFMDNAWEYHDGDSERRMGQALAQDGYRQKAFLMSKDCAHDRRADHSMWKLEDSLRRLQTDYLDLWQLHEVVWNDDVDWIFAPGGSAEALLKAKEKGLVRYIGFTGHKDPEIHRRMLSQGFPFDAVQMPLNLLDAHYKSFEQEILPICQEQGIAVIGMKSFSSGDIFELAATVTPAEALGYAMSLPVATVVSGMDSLEVMRQNLEIARGFEPFSAEQRTELLARTQPHSTGEYERFKTTYDFEGNVGRAAHGYPVKLGELVAD